MIGKTILHYPALCRCTAFRKAERDPEQRDKILAKPAAVGSAKAGWAWSTKLRTQNLPTEQ
jgi:hypothetical protein